MVGKPTNETLISDLELSVRTANCLHNVYWELNGYEPFEPRGPLPPPKIKDFRSLKDEDLLKFPNFGKKSLAEWNYILWLVDEPGEPAASNEYHLFRELRVTLMGIDRTRNELSSLVRRAQSLVDALEGIGANK